MKFRIPSTRDFIRYLNVNYRNVRLCSTVYNNKSRILGIETSCDDTGCAIVDSDGNILGDALHSQLQVHLRHGGINPPTARDLHEQHIHQVVQDAVTKANVRIEDLDAIATTVKPGLAVSLRVGMNYGKSLSKKYGKPFIPIHHMEAHALTIRMVQKVEFPFLVLLISGGHCLLAVALSVEKFLLLGKGLDDAPGEAFDKTARRLRLNSMPEFHNLCGGAAIELAAKKSTNAFAFDFPMILAQYRDCNFSMSGLKNVAVRHILKEEKIHGIQEEGIIPSVYDFCAGFQLAVTHHFCQRLQRAMEFISHKNLLPEDNRTLVISGGVASNAFVRNALNYVCQQYGYKLAAPPPRLCTDNGIMIAWNGVERWRIQAGITMDLDSVEVQPKCPLGEDWTTIVAESSIKCKWIKSKTLLDYCHKAEP